MSVIGACQGPNLSHLMAHKLLKFCGTPKIMAYAPLTKKKGRILIHSHPKAIVVLAVVTFSLDSLREKRWVPLTK